MKHQRGKEDISNILKLDNGNCVGRGFTGPHTPVASLKADLGDEEGYWYS